MSMDTALKRFRQRQESLFRDECSVTRASGDESEFDPVYGTYDPPTVDEVYDGPCQIRPAGGLVGTDVVAGEREWRLKDYIIKLPVDTSARENDLITCTGSTYDADLVDRVFRITDVLRDGRQIARVCVAEEAT